MALMVGCDVCGKFIKNVPWERRSEINNTEICSTCQKKQQVLDRYIEKSKSKFEHQFNQILTNAREELKKIILDIATKNKKEEEE